MATRSKESPAPTDPTGGNINQIRDILIGPFQREQQAQFARVEQTLERIAAEAEERTARAQGKLQKSLDGAVSALEARLGELGKRIDQLDEATKRQMSQLANDIEDKIKDVNKRLLAEVQDLERNTDKHFTALRHELDAAIANLRDEKTSRHDLGDYLTEIGLRLRGESTLADLDASLQDALDDADEQKQP